MHPLISIIIPSYNPGKLIKDTLNSVFHQNYQDWECLIIDDGSKDDSFSVIDEFLKKDDRFKYRERSEIHKAGGCGARNEGLDEATGEYVIFLDADDILMQDCLERRVAEIRPNYEMFIFPTGTFKKSLGDSEKIWNSLEGKGLDHHSLIKSFLNQDMPWHTNGVLWKRTFIDKIGRWDEDLKVWQDWEMHIRALLLYPEIILMNTAPDNFYRLNVKESIASGVNSKEYIVKVCEAISKVSCFINTRKEIFKAEMHALIIRNLIYKPILLKLYQLPFDLFSKGCFQTIGTVKFFHCYFQRLLMTSYRFRKLTGWRLDSEIIRKYHFKNTHLKLSREDINNEEIHIFK